ncbi:hypothetical protein BRADI_3g11594v3 [Brachypodium distachyon]|uniref:Uncharacterized protein n=1 Tax=Brachypodium distachyon TaxID=15368 RepID=A0A2K2CWP9_BRADI|nr:hypothetical protein BRADI_3g11594v3 [Brachypodium distachyon]
MKGMRHCRQLLRWAVRLSGEPAAARARGAGHGAGNRGVLRVAVRETVVREELRAASCRASGLESALMERDKAALLPVREERQGACHNRGARRSPPPRLPEPPGLNRAGRGSPSRGRTPVRAGGGLERLGRDYQLRPPRPASPGDTGRHGRTDARGGYGGRRSHRPAHLLAGTLPLNLALEIRFVPLICKLLIRVPI